MSEAQAQCEHRQFELGGWQWDKDRAPVKVTITCANCSKRWVFDNRQPEDVKLVEQVLDLAHAFGLRSQHLTGEARRLDEFEATLKSVAHAVGVQP